MAQPITVENITPETIVNFGGMRAQEFPVAVFAAEVLEFRPVDYSVLVQPFGAENMLTLHLNPGDIFELAKLA